MKSANLKFSIVIPTYNRPDRLNTCLESLTGLDYSRDRFEVIIVDDGSEQPLDNIVQRYDEQINITLVRQENKGPAQARNHGADIAQGEYLAFTDDDCTLAPDWLSALEKCLADHPNSLVGGYTINALENNLYSTASQLLINYIYEYYNVLSQGAQFFASNNFALARELFHKVGKFDVSFPLAAGEDREFCDRVLYRGYSLNYAPEAIIYHHHQLTLKKFWRQHFNYGCGAFFYHQIRSQRKQQPIKVEPLKFYFNLIKYPFISKVKSSKLYLSFLLFISQLANIMGFFQTKISQRLINQSN